MQGFKNYTNVCLNLAIYNKKKIVGKILNNKRISSVNLNYKMDNKDVLISSVYSYFN